MSQGKSQSEGELCKCGKVATTTTLKIIVGEFYMTQIDEPTCKSCKAAYDEGYKDGLDDSDG